MNKNKKKFGKKTGLLICIPCFLIAIISLVISLSNDVPYILYRVILAVMTFCLIFGLVVGFNTDWKS